MLEFYNLYNKLIKNRNAILKKKSNDKLKNGCITLNRVITTPNSADL